jgi:microcystin-dependent protein
LGGTTSFATTGHTHGHIAQGGLNSGSYIAINAGDGNLDAIGSYSFNTIVNGTAWFGGGTGGVTYERHQVTSSGPSATGTVSLSNANNTGGGSAHNNLQPYIVLNYIIKT